MYEVHDTSNQVWWYKLKHGISAWLKVEAAWGGFKLAVVFGCWAESEKKDRQQDPRLVDFKN